MIGSRPGKMGFEKKEYTKSRKVGKPEKERIPQREFKESGPLFHKDFDHKT
ncbi:hypothetical protein [Estrella lausannensis]|uniref:hypothetical protein n=1 Tax=Estrella lausannensis TaxID=483423 RepID=UPI0013044EB7|nr:hypothetical protein [Estrella lausannensis]